MKRRAPHRAAPKKPPRTEKSAPQTAVEFCTECGASLNEFCFSDGATNLRAIRENLARCKRKGKFDGAFCAKLFIALPTDIDLLSGDPSDEIGPA